MILVSSRGAVSDPVLRGLDNSRPLVYPPAYPIYSARTSSAGGESRLPQSLSSRVPCPQLPQRLACEKMADSSARNPSGVASELSSYSPQFVQISKVAYFFLATCCEECQRLSDRKQLSSSNLQYMLRRLATDRAVVVLPHAGKLQRFHRLSTGSGTRVVVLAEPHVFAPEQPPTIPGAVQLRLPSTRTVWNSSGRPCEWCRLARCAACG